ncbi:MAG: SDR family NAD(P)-dependent oxidoreductase [Lysobacteraceae bacterium]
MEARRVLITGAGSGLGQALALRYGRAGCAVACADLDLERARATVAMLPGDGHLALAVDVADDASFEAMVAELDRHWDHVDVLHNNAGIASGGPMVETTMAEWRRLLEVNLLSVVRGCRVFAPRMIARGRGQIASTASFAGLAAAPSIMSYGVSKASVVALSEQLRAELAPHGVTVSVLCPAFFPTRLLENFTGSERMRGFAGKMMERSPDTLDSVADRAFAALERGEFLVLPTRKEPMRWRIKRFFPNLYFRQLLKLAGGGRRRD